MVAREFSDAQLAWMRNKARPLWLWAGLVLVTATAALPAAHANSFSTGTRVQVSGPDPFTADSSFDMHQAPNAGGFFAGDYEALTAVGNDFIAFFAQAGNTADPSSIFARRRSAP